VDVTIDLIDILLSHARGAHIYNIESSAYANTYRNVHPTVSYLNSNKTYKVLEHLYNETYKDDGVTIKHNKNNLNVTFNFISEKHHTMFMLKYS